MAAENPRKHNARRQPGEVGKAENSSGHSLHPNDAAAQRLRILARLRLGPATTIQLRRDVDCMMPAARIFELRHIFGYEIPLVWTQDQTECGQKHRVGLYSLRPAASGSTRATNPDNGPRRVEEAQ